MPTIAQLHAAQQRGHEADRLLAETAAAASTAANTSSSTSYVDAAVPSPILPPPVFGCYPSRDPPTAELEIESACQIWGIQPLVNIDSTGHGGAYRASRADWQFGLADDVNGESFSWFNCNSNSIISFDAVSMYPSVKFIQIESYDNYNNKISGTNEFVFELWFCLWWHCNFLKPKIISDSLSQNQDNCSMEQAKELGILANSGVLGQSGVWFRQEQLKW
jgi:hypothetical protein